MGIRINGSTSGYTEIDAPAEGGNSTAGIILPAGTTAERPASGQAGQMRFNTTTGQFEYWSSNSTTPGWREITRGPVTPITARLLIVGGGGAGGDGSGAGGASGGGGAGGMISIASQEMLGDYTVTVGTGGPADTSLGNRTAGANGNDSSIVKICGDYSINQIAVGGGGGGTDYSASAAADAKSGGSGGGQGAGVNTPGGNTGTAGQGNDGGGVNTWGGTYISGGGGGAGSAGSDTRDGGAGLADDITGTSVFYAGGGAGGTANLGGNGTGGTGGGGNGGSTGSAGTDGLGGGGGARGGKGGDGIVIIRVPTSASVTIGAGLTSSSATVGSDTVYSFTAGTGTVTIAE